MKSNTVSDMAAETSQCIENHPPKGWEGTLRDVVSLILYCTAEGDHENYETIQVMAFHHEGVIGIPRKEITAQDASSSQDPQSPSVKAAPSDSSPVLLWPRDVSYAHVAHTLAKRITKGASVQLPQPYLVQITRIYVPSLRKPYQHSVFALPVKQNDCLKWCSVGRCEMMSLEDLRNNIYKLERRDIITIVEHIQNQVKGTSGVVGAIIKEIGPHQVWRPVSFQNQSPDDALIRSPGYREQDIELLFEEYVRCSYPHSTVSFANMKQLITDLGWKDKEQKIFRAMDRRRIGELGPKEFILGLTAMDPMTSHGRGPAEMRCRYIFKYYDNNEDDVLELEELKQMIMDIAHMQGQEVSPENLDARTEKALDSFGMPEDSSLPLAEFLVGVGSLRFRGTSLLFRAKMSIVPHLLHKHNHSSGMEKDSPFRSPQSPGSERKRLKRNSPDLSKDSNNIIRDLVAPQEIEKADQDVVMRSVDSSSPASIPLSDGAFASQDSSDYTLAQHTVKVRRSGQITDIHLLLDMERAGEVCDTGFDVEESSGKEVTRGVKAGRGSVNSRNIPQFHHRMFDRFMSVEAFNIRSLPNEMITALRFFEHEKSSKPALHWGEVDIVKLGQYILSLCSAIKEVMENEPRLLWLSTPCYVLGDIHGNYQDLVCFEKALWRVGPHLTPANFLFLGDYVDRGDYGVEVVCYLFAQKMQAPQKFFLLRGNHEVRDIQEMFTFKAECVNKFGERLGLNVWNAVNEVFDRMPLAAVVDKKIFCIHGGIPKLDGNVRDLEKIPCPLPNPETQSNLAWQMMWNDPVTYAELTEETQEELKTNKGFAYNDKRQTAYVFDQAAFDHFLEKNNLTHVVRAHEVKQAGFEIQQSGRLMTVFSSSHYCGGSNEAACILVHNYRMRIIRIDTT